MSPSRRHILVGSLAALAGVPTARADAGGRAARLVAAASAQVGVTTTYDPAYQRIPFPGGDVPRDRGVCTDVVVRAYRDALGLDLQALVNADMRASFAAYPKRWGLDKPDPSIDHRRVGNLRVFLARQKAELAVPTAASGWEPGDIVTQELVASDSRRPGLPHIGIVGERVDATSGRPLVIHNVGSGTRVEDILETWRITGRYRWLPDGT